MTTIQFFNELDSLLTDFTAGTKSRDEFAAAFVSKVRESCNPSPTQAMNLALQVKKVRDTQNLYFASRTKGRFGDKAILKESKRLEKELDQMTDVVLNQL